MSIVIIRNNIILNLKATINNLKHDFEWSAMDNCIISFLENPKSIICNIFKFRIFY